MPTVEEFLDSMTAEGELYETLPGGAARCTACGHRCLVRPDRRGICKVRFNRANKLQVPWGYVAGLNADPIEKKPFYHVLSGADALTFGMLGCDFHCDFCQNALSSQVLRDPLSNEAARWVRRATPQQIVDSALRSQSEVIASSYNEPLITSEWAFAIFKLAVAQGIKCVYVSNGNATREVLEYLRPYLSAYKIDLKTMQDKQYRQCGGVLQNVLDGIRMAHEMGLWVEVVTLVIPGYNDSTDELMDAARYIKSISADIPWHVTAFHPDYKMTEPPPTPAHTIIRAAEIGLEAGLNFVYAGNLVGRVKEYENTYCPQCHTELIERYGYTILSYSITAEGKCPKCGTSIPGIWTDNPKMVRAERLGMPRKIR